MTFLYPAALVYSQPEKLAVNVSFSELKEPLKMFASIMVSLLKFWSLTSSRRPELNVVMLPFVSRR